MGWRIGGSTGRGKPDCLFSTLCHSRAGGNPQPDLNAPDNTPVVGGERRFMNSHIRGNDNVDVDDG
jgi:hypothetical protein